MSLDVETALVIAAVGAATALLIRNARRSLRCVRPDAPRTCSACDCPLSMACDGARSVAGRVPGRRKAAKAAVLDGGEIPLEKS